MQRKSICELEQRSSPFPKSVAKNGFRPQKGGWLFCERLLEKNLLE
jgi:hypothetical protein